MKRTTLITLLILALLISACSKNKTATYGSYTFKSQTYTIGFADWVRGYFVGYTQTNFPTGSLAFSFDDTAHAVPVSINQFTLPKNKNYPASYVDPPDSGYVFIRLTDSSANRTFFSVPRPTGQVTVSIDTPSGRNLNITITNVLMQSSANAADTALLNGTFKQSR